MKTIGMLGGMSWESSLEYYRIINESVKSRLGGLHSAKSLMFSFDFEEIEALAAHCRYADCSHVSEPGCAVRSAIERGEIEESRLSRWRKLSAEERRNSETLAERRARDKDFGKMVRKVMREKTGRRSR